jgi:hypothetical protein
MRRLIESGIVATLCDLARYTPAKPIYAQCCQATQERILRVRQSISSLGQLFGTLEMAAFG